MNKKRRVRPAELQAKVGRDAVRGVENHPGNRAGIRRASGPGWPVEKKILERAEALFEIKRGPQPEGCDEPGRPTIRRDRAAEGWLKKCGGSQLGDAPDADLPRARRIAAGASVRTGRGVACDALQADGGSPGAARRSGPATTRAHRRAGHAPTVLRPPSKGVFLRACGHRFHCACVRPLMRELGLAGIAPRLATGFHATRTDGRIKR